MKLNQQCTFTDKNIMISNLTWLVRFKFSLCYNSRKLARTHVSENSKDIDSIHKKFGNFPYKLNVYVRFVKYTAL
jgi:hypothetical protein